MVLADVKIARTFASRFYLELQVSRRKQRRNLCLTSYSLHLLRYQLHSEGIPFPRVIIVFEYYKGRRLRPKEVVYFRRLEPVDPPALACASRRPGPSSLLQLYSHGGQLPSATL